MDDGFDDVYDSKPLVHKCFVDDEPSELPEVSGCITLVDMKPLSTFSVIDTVDGVSRLIDQIRFHMPDKVSKFGHDSELALMLDVKGINLGRGGTVSILQVRIHPTLDNFLVDIYRLGWQVFTTPGKLYPSETMTSILTSSLFPKVFFDVRNGPGALFNQFKISVDNVLDLQLMEFYTRRFKASYGTQLLCFWECLARDSGLDRATRANCRKIRDTGRALFAPNHGGNPQMFNVRPMNDDLKDCIIQDLILMSVLYKCYKSKLTISTRLMMEAEVTRKLKDVQSRRYPTGNKSIRKHGYQGGK
jgi:exonuclease 3'-5' domain-containing protein 1